MANGATEGGKRFNFRIVAGCFGAIVLTLAAAYAAFLNFDYRALYQDLDPADAAAIVASLEERGIKHKLTDGGTAILVRAREADAVRLALINAQAPINGLVGFELFDESDMGLTDFSQRIKFQRALQGELARTIATIDGVAAVRVHLSIPEQSYFRGAVATPKAAVTITPKAGVRFDDKAKIIGVQRLVAAAVPGLEPQNVAILGEAGEIISGVEEAVRPRGAETIGALLEVERYFRSRALQALSLGFDGIDFDVLVAATRRRGAALEPGATETPGPFGDDPDRDYVISITVVTAAPLTAAEKAQATKALVAAIEFRTDFGDRIGFETPIVPEAVRRAAAAKAERLAAETVSKASASDQSQWIFFALMAAFAGASSAVLWRRRAPSRLSQDAVASIAARLRLSFQSAAGNVDEPR